MCVAFFIVVMLFFSDFVVLSIWGMDGCVGCF